jgi:acylglycerol lipase
MMRFSVFHTGGIAAATRAPALRRALLPVVLITLGACASGGGGGEFHSEPTTPPSAPSTASVRVGFTDNAFTTTDGEALPLRTWLPQGDVKAVILALHGMNDYSNAFDIPAPRWAERGIATYAYDQRGFGNAPQRARWAGTAALASDAVTAIRLLHRKYPGRPVYLLGESMGGAVAIAALTGVAGVPPAEIDGAILVAPAVWGRPTMDLLPKVALWAGVRIFPSVALSGQSLQIMPSDNMPMLRAFSGDPLVIKETRVDAVYGLVDLMDAALVAAPRLDVPLLVLYGAHDEVIPPAAIRTFVEHLPANPAQSRRLSYYPQGWHMLLRDLDGAMVAGDVAAWVFDRRAALPSHLDAASSQRPWPPLGATAANTTTH